MTRKTPELTSPGGTAILWDGPSAAAVRTALTKGGHTRSVKPKGKGPLALPSIGFVVVKPRDVAYAEVSTTSGEKAGFLRRYANTLTRAGFVVEPDQHYPGSKIIVFAPDPRFTTE